MTAAEDDDRRHLEDLLYEHDVPSDVDDPLGALRLKSGWSLAQIVAELVEEEQEAILAELDADKLVYDWEFWGRPSQLPPDDESWKLFAFIGGRGTGKTRAGSEWVHKMALKYPGCRIALVGRTSSDPRDVMIEGDSGILGIASPETRPTYFSSKRRLVWPNGSQATTFTSEEPSQLRGPQFHFSWADEAAAWKHTQDDSGLNAWDNLVIATRLPMAGATNQVFITTTPKRTPFMFDLLEKEKEDEKVLTARGTTADNVGNLDPDYVKDMYQRYEGTRLMEQELYGILLDKVDGALWDDELIQAGRVNQAPAGLLKIIAVDPTVAEEPNDQCGIIVLGATKQRKLKDRHAYVLEDCTIKASPTDWVAHLVKVWERHKCPIVVESNQGGALVATLLHQINPAIPVLEVWSAPGKALRAEPAALRYDKTQVHHVGVLAELESEQTSWVPGETKKSPDRVDALVHGITALLIKPPNRLGSRRMTVKSMASRKLPEGKMGR